MADFEQEYKEAEAVLHRCQHPDRTCELSTGGVVCDDCWNTYARARQAIRKRELAAMPRCECCNRRGTWWVAGVLLCGHHKRAAEAGATRAVLGGGSVGVALGMFGGIDWRREDILAFAKGER